MLSGAWMPIDILSSRQFSEKFPEKQGPRRYPMSPPLRSDQPLHGKYFMFLDRRYPDAPSEIRQQYSKVLEVGVH